ncbi:MAG: hypothetical protein EP329_23360 [Deltaproteobacteria bacterium]|nr:MAG: hypothetical protein EP329_23360 [Deltaproteobacteria bacterium]
MTMTAQPDPSATIVLLAEDTPPPEIFFVRRHARSAFMANAWVFPGGRLDVLDFDQRVFARLDGVDAAGLVARMHGVDEPDVARALVVCALRETFEEAGVLLGTEPSGAPLVGPRVAALAEARAALLAGELSFPSMLVELDVRLDGGALVYFDHWITPPIEKRRFDTRFFVARAPAAQEPRHDAAETTDSAWLSAPRALDRHAVGDLGLAPPTFWILGDLARHADADAILAWAAAREVPAIRPSVSPVDGALCIALPGDPLHPVHAGPDAPRRRVVWGGTCWTREG